MIRVKYSTNSHFFIIYNFGEIEHINSFLRGKENKITIQIKKETCYYYLDNHYNPNQKKFNVEFDNFISNELQKLGYKCFLRSKNNRFLTDGKWHGNF